MLKELKQTEHNIILDLRYASVNNVCNRVLYKEPKCFISDEAFDHLMLARDLAFEQGYKLKIFDAYRPVQIQKEMFELFGDNGFVSNPATGSIPHCRGVAVDLTLTDLGGNELDMGSDFDEFSEIAFHGNASVSDLAKKNRYLLLGIMMTAGFDFFRNEWWHYQLFNARSYEIYNLPL